MNKSLHSVRAGVQRGLVLSGAVTASVALHLAAALAAGFLLSRVRWELILPEFQEGVSSIEISFVPAPPSETPPAPEVQPPAPPEPAPPVIEPPPPPLIEEPPPPPEPPIEPPPPEPVVKEPLPPEPPPPASTPPPAAPAPPKPAPKPQPPAHPPQPQPVATPAGAYASPAPGNPLPKGVLLAESFNAEVRPTYPMNARIRGEEGVVKALVTLRADGRVEAVEMEAGSGHSSLDRSALGALRRGRFRSKSGRIEAGTKVRISIRYRLTEPE